MNRNRPSKAILAENLSALMANSLNYTSNDKVVARCKIPGRTVGRVRNGDHSAQTDTIDKIAKVFGLETWQLFVPGLDPKNLPILLKTETELEIVRALRTRPNDGVSPNDGD